MKSFLDRINKGLPAFKVHAMALRIGSPSTSADRQKAVDELYGKARSLVYSAANKVFNRVCSGNGKNHRKAPRTEEVKEAAREYRDLLINVSHSPSGGFSSGLAAAMRAAADKLKTAKVKAHREGWKSFVSKLDEMPTGNTMQTLSRIRRGKLKGTQLPMTQSKLEGIARHYNKQFQPCVSVVNEPMPQQLPPDNDYTELDQGDAFESPLQNDMVKLEPIDIASLINGSGNGKAPGNDGLMKELMMVTNKVAEDKEEANKHPICQLLSVLFKTCWQLGTTPTRWGESLVVPIYKGSGSRKDYANWRPIALLQYWRKLFETAFTPAITLNGFHHMQGGFQSQRSTIDQVMALQTAIEEARKVQKPVYIAFLDIWAAYDTVNRNLLWNRMRERGTDERVIRILARLARSNTFQVIGDGMGSAKYKAAAGVQQGGTLSPHMYNIMIDQLCRRLARYGKQNPRGIVSMSGTPLNGFLYADDVALVATSPAALREMLKICEQHSHEMNYRWKPAKSVIVGPPFTSPVFRLYGQDLKQVRVFKYLGVPFDHNGINAKALVKISTERACQANAIMCHLGLRAHGISIYKRVQLWKTFVRSCLDYATFLVSPKGSQMKSLEMVNNRGMRNALGGKNKSSIAAMQLLSQSTSYVMRMKILQAKYLLRMQETTRRSLIGRIWRQAATSNGLVKQMLTGNPVWQLARGDNNEEVTYHRLTESIRQYIKREEENLRRDGKQREHSALLRDLPPNTGKRTPFRSLQKEHWSHYDTSRLFHWLTGAFPGHKQEYCHICCQRLPIWGSRDHAAACVQAIVLEQQDPPKLTTAMKLRANTELQYRHSENWITEVVWLAQLKRNGWNSSPGLLVRNALRAIHLECLKRESDPDSPQTPDPESSAEA